MYDCWSRINYANSILTCIYSCNIHHLQCIQNSLTSHDTLNNQHRLCSHWLPIRQRLVKLANLIHRSLHKLATLVHHLVPSILVIFTTLLHSIASASICLPQSPHSTSYPHCSCLSWFSVCMPFYMEFSPSSSQINWLLHCLQVKSKKINYSLMQEFLGILALTILSMRFWFDMINSDFCVEIILYYITLQM